jgi:hypothetical protein
MRLRRIDPLHIGQRLLPHALNRPAIPVIRPRRQLWIAPVRLPARQRQIQEQVVGCEEICQVVRPGL